MKLSSFAGSFLGLGAKPVVRAVGVVMVSEDEILQLLCVGVVGVGLGRWLRQHSTEISSKGRSRILMRPAAEVHPVRHIH